MGIIEDALTDFVVNHFEGELEKVQKVKSELQELRSTVEDLEEKVDRLLEEEDQGGQTDSTSGDEETTQKRVSSRTLKSIRDHFDLTQKELAELLGVSSVTVSSWESGDTKPQKGNKEKIVELREKSKTEVDDKLDRGEKEEQQDDSDATISGDEIKQIRANLDLSQSALAEELGVSAGTVSNWERGQSNPGSDSVKAIRDLAEHGDTNDGGDAGEAFSGADLKELREEKGLSQSELADELDVSAGTISNWERGKGSVSESAIEKIKEL